MFGRFTSGGSENKSRVKRKVLRFGWRAVERFFRVREKSVAATLRGFEIVLLPAEYSPVIGWSGV